MSSVLDTDRTASVPTAVAAFSELREMVLRIRQTGRALWNENFIDLGRSEPLSSWEGMPQDEGLSRRLARLYGSVAGLDSVRERLAEHYSRQIDLPLTRDNLMLVSGSMAGVFMSLLSIMRPGDEVLLPVPHYHAYPSQIEMVGGIVRAIDTTSRNYRLTPDMLGSAITDRTRVLLLNNPVNPTGIVYDRAAIAALLEVLPPGTFVLADEVYADFVFAQPFASAASVMWHRPDLPWVVLRSASKTCGQPGWRVGIAIGPASQIGRLNAVASVVTSAPNVNAQLRVSTAIPEAARANQSAPLITRARDVMKLLSDCPWIRALEPQGTYYVWIELLDGIRPRRSMAHLEGWARKAGVFVLPGEYFGVPAGFRLSTSVSRDQLRAGISSLVRWSGSLSE